MSWESQLECKHRFRGYAEAQIVLGSVGNDQETCSQAKDALLDLAFECTLGCGADARDPHWHYEWDMGDDWPFENVGELREEFCPAVRFPIAERWAKPWQGLRSEGASVS